MIAPSGRAASPTPNVASEASSAEVGSIDGKKSLGQNRRGQCAVEREIEPLERGADRGGGHRSRAHRGVRAGLCILNHVVSLILVPLSDVGTSVELARPASALLSSCFVR